MKPYELILLFDPALGEEKTKAFIAKIEEKIKSWGGTVEKTDIWGLKKLSSMISRAKKLTQANYVCIYFQGPGALPTELNNYLKVSEQVARYFLSTAEALPPEKPPVPASAEAVEVGEIKGEPLGES